MVDYIFEVPKYSFIQFDTELSCCGCDAIFEVVYASDIAFFVKTSHTMYVHICDMSGKVLFRINDMLGDYFHLKDSIDLSKYLGEGDCFRLRLDNGFDKFYSSMFIYMPESKHPLVRYRSKNKTYFPFENNQFVSIRLPILLTNQSPKTEKEEYIDANGRIHNPFTQRRYTYVLNVDYTTQEIHKKLQVALMHDITIDGLEVNETGDYEIDYETEIKEGDDSTPLHKATSELSAQDILLMRNY